ncbi:MULTISPECIES: hypothetical protein [Xanthomonas]|uniref:Uncharacterized protein n=3 Tax=Xanthomonas TaxID=338 RepID=A0A7Z7J0C6_XANCH|nr:MULTISPECIES: hypothetical protein [Xanthomonas]ATS86826.1 hypothetical protein XcfCFBP6991P_23345 [Xanthomonas citri pv. phaseoli var. fuscans]WOP59011.1 hypothetical protein R5577_23110 [Xanthomonas euvesicatoria]SOO23785.1 exported hypothetical protein [Xanthomonas phaseoli pv. phaseoli]
MVDRIAVTPRRATLLAAKFVLVALVAVVAAPVPGRLSAAATAGTMKAYDFVANYWWTFGTGHGI